MLNRSTERGRLWGWFKRKFHLNDNPFWEVLERRPLKAKRAYWWHIALAGRIFLWLNIIAVGLFLFFFIQQGAYSGYYPGIEAWFQPWWIMWAVVGLFVVWCMPLFFWCRAVMIVSAERRRGEGWDLFLASPLTYRQLYWAKMTPVLREALVLLLYLGLSVLSIALTALGVSLWETNMYHGWYWELLTTCFWIVFTCVNAVLCFLGGILITGAIVITKRTTISAFGWAFGVTLGCGMALSVVLPLIGYLLGYWFWGFMDETAGIVFMALLTACFTAVIVCAGPWYIRWLDRKRDPLGTRELQVDAWKGVNSEGTDSWQI